MNLDEYKSVGIVLYVNGNNRICFASFGAENIIKEIKTFLGNKIVTKIFIEYSAIMLEYSCVGFIDFMFKEKSEILLIYFQQRTLNTMIKFILNYFLNFLIEIDTRMVEITTCGTANMHPQLDNVMQFKIDKINEIKGYSIAEIYKREKTSKTLSRHAGLVFPISNGYANKFLKTMRKRKKHYKNVFISKK